MHYPIVEHFRTLQGEGYWTGTPAYFIRLGGCDVGCHWCDVKESWDAAAHPVLAVDDLVAAAQASGVGCVVITGGEPTLHDLGPLTAALKAAGLRTHLETAGTNALTGAFDWVTFSPKKFQAPLGESYALANELKVVVHHPSDLPWAEGHADRCAPGTALFLQPEWYKEESTAWVLAYAQTHPRWRVSLQTHKFVGLR